jgi:hypothetical protein
VTELLRLTTEIVCHNSRLSISTRNRLLAIEIVILEAFLHVQAPLPNGPVLQLCEASYPESGGQVLSE